MMSTAEILSLVSLISYIVAGVCLVLTVFFWFAFKIPSVIGDLSGRTARKSIARMRASNEKAAGKGYRPSTANLRRGKVTETMSHAKQTGPQGRQTGGQAAQQQAAQANAYARQQAAQAAAQAQYDPGARPETGLLNSNRQEAAMEATARLEEETAPLYEEAEETAPLTADAPIMPRRTSSVSMTVLETVMLVHTNEVI